MPRISDLPLTSSVDDATSFVAVSANGTTYKISLANALAASTGATFFDSDSSHIITLAGGSNLSANRTLTLTTGDADRTLDISAGNTTISAFAITILDDANAAAVRATLGLGSMALETATDYLTVASAASGYQPLDADLTTLAANITTFGHSLVDDADNTAARTTLGLGTAAIQNTGTSGATIPLLNASNTFSALTQFTAATNLFNYADDGAGSGPNVVLRRTSASPAANDLVGVFSWSAQDSGGNLFTVGQLQGIIVDPTDGSEDSGFNMTATIAGTLANVFSIGNGALCNGATGGFQGNGTLNAVTLYENGTSLAAKYQGLDSELTAIAGLTSAADRLPYFTGSGTAALATFTTAGRNLLDDADSTAQRTTLGLGTAATQNTGTSGANLPFLNGSNTWSAQNIFSSASNISNILAISTEGSASAGPFISVRRAGGSPAANDAIGVFNFQGEDSALNNTNYAQLQCDILDPTDTSEDGQFAFNTVVAGTLTFRMKIAGGVWVGSPTGGDKGSGTFNATTIYENGSTLTSLYARLGAANTFTNPQRLPSYTVAGLPAGAAGDIAFTSNGRKNGEGAGAGTGVLVFHDGTAWRACDTGATVAA